MADPRRDANPKRMTAPEELRDLISGLIARKNRDHWPTVANKAGVPCGVAQGLAQVF
ncbi:CoA transferase [Paracoccus homiensis]|uniref:CoA transferase n=1 Tax=Paracoccus homiensis TaxID=364199 RepID=UPI0015877F7B|nr:CoA transferase [Paracoccus homiensis]